MKNIQYTKCVFKLLIWIAAFSCLESWSYFIYSLDDFVYALSILSEEQKEGLCSQLTFSKKEISENQNERICNFCTKLKEYIIYAPEDWMLAGSIRGLSNFAWWEEAKMNISDWEEIAVSLSPYDISRELILALPQQRKKFCIALKESKLKVLNQILAACITQNGQKLINWVGLTQRYVDVFIGFVAHFEQPTYLAPSLFQYLKNDEDPNHDALNAIKDDSGSYETRVKNLYQLLNSNLCIYPKLELGWQ